MFCFKGCNCDVHGSNGNTCDENGVCSCKSNVINAKCDSCEDGFFNFPICEGKQYYRARIHKDWNYKIGCM